MARFRRTHDHFDFDEYDEYYTENYDQFFDDDATYYDSNQVNNFSADTKEYEEEKIYNNNNHRFQRQRFQGKSDFASNTNYYQNSNAKYNNNHNNNNNNNGYYNHNRRYQPRSLNYNKRQNHVTDTNVSHGYRYQKHDNYNSQYNRGGSNRNINSNMKNNNRNSSNWNSNKLVQHRQSCGVPIVSITNGNECVNWMNQLLSCPTNIFAIDCEWRPNFTKGKPQNKVSILQISNHKLCLIIYLQRLFNSKDGIPNVLVQFLEDKQYIKIGVGIGGDALKLEGDYCIVMKSCLDIGDFIISKCSFVQDMKDKISKISKNKLKIENGMRQTRIKLQTLDGIVYLLTNGINIGKTKQTTLSNWERYPLSKYQISYASRDVIFPFYAFVQAMLNISNQQLTFDMINYTDISFNQDNNNNSNNSNNNINNNSSNKVINDDIVEITITSATENNGLMNNIEDIIDPQIKMKEKRKTKRNKKNSKKGKKKGKYVPKIKNLIGGNTNGNTNGNRNETIIAQENNNNNNNNNSETAKIVEELMQAKVIEMVVAEIEKEFKAKQVGSENRQENKEEEEKEAQSMQTETSQEIFVDNPVTTVAQYC